ncbi:MBL fold metallo-hydrolase [Halobellus clavatus]|jgi:hydroxyacylglutathione hydrolase|uniref:Hydroxyacylglutathione hydrolase n=1 Tax=Halobellus clavatus TaxID=660517 RepID=A0A1H3DPA5_9EURY|nr:MBL fold metallo-hydrolase [Halobellus clavatus]SDX67928.1 hydroxyacylglutathione hydrolase [Halobellus clavatus]
MDIHTVTDGATEFTCNAYLLAGDSPALVDAGSMPGVEDVIADHVDDLDAVYLTHQHRDHVGELDAVLDRFDADLYAYGEHPRRTAALSDGQELSLAGESYEVVFTPGHADDHVSLVGETRVFSGDVVVYNDGAFDDGSFGRTDLSGQSRERLIESLETILDRLPDTVAELYAGHGDVYRADPDGDDDSVRDVIERALERAERREPKYPDE